jgi:hypothetical protein
MSQAVPSLGERGWGEGAPAATFILAKRAAPRLALSRMERNRSRSVARLPRVVRLSRTQYGLARLQDANQAFLAMLHGTAH